MTNLPRIPRRAFLNYSARLAALWGLGASAAPALAEALAQLAQGTARVLWLQGQSCSGCSVALLNSQPLTPAQLLTRCFSLAFHQTLSSATGQQAVGAVKQVIAHGGYFLAVEGSVPLGMPTACIFGEEPFAPQLARAARNAKAILAVGTCAAFGGIPAAPGNPTGRCPGRPLGLAERGAYPPRRGLPVGRPEPGLRRGGRSRNSTAIKTLRRGS